MPEVTTKVEALVLSPESVSMKKNSTTQIADSDRQLQIADLKYCLICPSLFLRFSCRPICVLERDIKIDSAVVRKPPEIAAAETIAANNSFAKELGIVISRNHHTLAPATVTNNGPQDSSRSRLITVLPQSIQPGPAGPSQHPDSRVEGVPVFNYF